MSLKDAICRYDAPIQLQRVNHRCCIGASCRPFRSVSMPKGRYDAWIQLRQTTHQGCIHASWRPRAWCNNAVSRPQSAKELDIDSTEDAEGPSKLKYLFCFDWWNSTKSEVAPRYQFCVWGVAIGLEPPTLGPSERKFTKVARVTQWYHVSHS